jgi:hypothetical protein
MGMETSRLFERMMRWRSMRSHCLGPSYCLYIFVFVFELGSWQGEGKCAVAIEKWEELR